MRYRFRGLVRDTGKPVEGHVEADTEEFAFHLLANNGIVTESLRPDPRPEDLRPPSPPPPASPLLPPMGSMTPGVARPASPMSAMPPSAAYPPPQAYVPPAGAQGQQAYPGQPPVDNTPIPGAPEVVNAIDSALDSSSSQIEFDALNEKFRGKKVWVIDRDKIKRNVARVVDQAITQSLKDEVGTRETRERVAEAIEGLFKDNRNLTSQHNANTQHLDKQVSRLANLLKNFESSLATMQMAIRGIGSGGGGGGGSFTPRRYVGQQQQGLHEEQNAVLLEIFKSNIELLRNMEDEMRRVNDVADAAVAQPAESGNPAT